MKDAAKTWALIVGIERYDSPQLRQLTGPINDAVAAVDWLRALGVPDANIRLNVAPRDDPRIRALGIAPQNADNGSIWKSIGDLVSGERLFVFLSGHGIYDTESRQRLFLTQEYAVANDFAATLDVAKYIDYFRSLNFSRQFLFFDGCQNHSTDTGQRSPIIPTGPKNNNFVPDPRNGLIACFAAGQGERAIEVESRGAMLRRLFDALDVGQLKRLAAFDRRQDAIEYGWNDGSLLLDLEALFKDIIRPYVQADAANLGYTQTPGLEPYGNATAAFTAILTLPPLPTVELTTDVEPLVARASVQRVHLHLRLPSRDRDLPIIPHPLVLPDCCRLPMNCDVELICVPAAGWKVKEAPQPFTATQPQHKAIFKLVHQPSPPPPSDLHSFNVRFTRDPGAELSSDDYHDLAAGIGARAQPRAKTEELMIPHEYGPDFTVGPAGIGATRNLAMGWARALRKWAPTEVDMVIAPPGQTVEASLPNLRFDVNTGWAGSLAGFLRDAPVITIARSERSQREPLAITYAARELEDLRAVHAETGRNRVHIELPWGAWTEFVDVPHGGEVSLAPPDRLGLPPLRNQAPLDCPIGMILVKGECKISISEYITGSTFALEPELVADGWNYFRVGGMADQFGSTLVSLDYHSGAPTFDDHKMQFMLPATRLPLTLLVDLRNFPPRLEAYSDTSQIEWDLIVSCGRLDAIPPERLTALCDESWPVKESWFLQVGLAYAAYATGSWQNLQKAISHLRSAGVDLVDIDLLDLECRKQVDPKWETVVELMLRLTERLRSDLPVFRWGMPIARRASDDKQEFDSLENAMPMASTFVTWMAAAGTTDKTPTPGTKEHGAEERHTEAATAVAYGEVPRRDLSYR